MKARQRSYKTKMIMTLLGVRVNSSLFDNYLHNYYLIPVKDKTIVNIYWNIYGILEEAAS
jgi:hypothetical protein